MAEIDVINDKGKVKSSFKDTFPHFYGLRVGTITDNILLGYFKMTRKDTNCTYKIKKLEELADLGTTNY